MISFAILKQSKKSRARIGILSTPHGEVETPALVAVATRAVVKTLTHEQAAATGTQIAIANTFHLHLRPGEKVVERAGGLHTFMAWDKPLMTDSGGFQVFSLGFGRDLGVGKLLKIFPEIRGEVIRAHAQPKALRITPAGVAFRSPIDGKELFIGPRESIRIQERLGADIIFAFDECTPPLAAKAYVREALARTHRWARICVEAKRSRQALFGIVQGSKYKDLREESARFIGSMPFAGFGIGGDLGESKRTMRDILRWVNPLLPHEKPRHLLGIGYLEDMLPIIQEGIDLFDCTAPTHFARRGIAFITKGRIDLAQSKYLSDKKPLDARCACTTCARYRRNYISHLVRAGESTAGTLLTIHNLFFFHAYIALLRTKIKKGII